MQFICIVHAVKINYLKQLSCQGFVLKISMQVKLAASNQPGQKRTNKIGKAKKSLKCKKARCLFREYKRYGKEEMNATLTIGKIY